MKGIGDWFIATIVRIKTLDLHKFGDTKKSFQLNPFYYSRSRLCSHSLCTTYALYEETVMRVQKRLFVIMYPGTTVSLLTF